MCYVCQFCLHILFMMMAWSENLFKVNDQNNGQILLAFFGLEWSELQKSSLLEYRDTILLQSALCFYISHN